MCSNEKSFKFCSILQHVSVIIAGMWSERGVVFMWFHMGASAVPAEKQNTPHPSTQSYPLTWIWINYYTIAMSIFTNMPGSGDLTAALCEYSDHPRVTREQGHPYLGAGRGQHPLPFLSCSFWAWLFPCLWPLLKPLEADTTTLL